jgi:NTE family protein
MTFSGGGSRAAALAASVLKDMARRTYSLPSGRYALTSDIKLISSVSGSSVTAAWFGWKRNDLHPDGDLDALRDKFLSKDNMSELEWEAANPITWFRLAFTSYTRIEALEDLFDRKLFGGAKMQELNQPGKPIILLNATDIAGGNTFALSPDRMDDICSSLDDLKISTGVSASAAFPVLLSPVSFRDYSDACAGNLRSAKWITMALSSTADTVHQNLERYRQARYSNDLRHGENPFRTIENLYFLDGGLADNVGIKTLLWNLVSVQSSTGLLTALDSGHFKKLVIVVVNARSDPPNGLYQREATPGLVSAINAVTSVPIDANTTNSQNALSQVLTQIASYAASGDPAKYRGMKVYGVTVDFDQIPSDTPEHRKLRDAIKDIPTSWTLSQDQLQSIDDATLLLLRADPCYAALINDLNASRGPEELSSKPDCGTSM